MPTPLDPRHKIGPEWTHRTEQVWTPKQTAQEAVKAAKAEPAPVPTNDPYKDSWARFLYALKGANALIGQMNPPPELKNPIVDEMVRAAADWLKAYGVKIVVEERTAQKPPRIRIVPGDGRLLNRVARDLMVESGTAVVYAPDQIVGTGAGARFLPSENSVQLADRQLLNPGKLEESTAHEGIHAKNHFADRTGHPWLSSGWATTGAKAKLSEVQKKSPVYRNFMAFSEMPAHLVSVTAKLNEYLQAEPTARKGKASELQYALAYVLDVALRAEGLLHRGLKSLGYDEVIDYVSKTSTGALVQPFAYFVTDDHQLELVVTLHAQEAHAVQMVLPVVNVDQHRFASVPTGNVNDPRLLSGVQGHENEQLQERLEIAKTYVSVGRLLQTLLDTHPDDNVGLKLVLDMLNALNEDRERGEIRYPSFEKLVALYNERREAA